MLNRCVVEPVDLDAIVSGKYHVSLATIGFEKRSRYLFSTHDINAHAKIASAFTDRNELSFEENREFFRQAGFSVDSHSILEFGETFLKAVRLADESNDLKEDGIVRVCVDISAMSRARMAEIIEVALNTDWHHQIAVDFVYCIAAYSPPPDESSFIASAQPISRSFSGWSTEPDTATCAIFGVGYEPDRVIGAIEYIEPGFVWAFVPEGPDPQFAEAVKKVNSQLWKDIPEQCVIRYRLDQPFNTFVSLESLIYSLSRKHRPVLIPFGPKLFTIQCLLAAVVHSPSVAVWRVSGGETAPSEDREAAGEVYSLRAIFGTA